MMREVTDRHAPGIANRGRSTGQRHVLEMSGAVETFVARYKHLPSPDVAVGAVAGAIERKTDYTACEVVLRHTTCNVGVVVLDANEGDSFLLERPFCGEIIGVKVVGDDLGMDFEDALEVRDGFVEKTITFDIF